MPARAACWHWHSSLQWRWRGAREEWDVPRADARTLRGMHCAASTTPNSTSISVALRVAGDVSLAGAAGLPLTT